MNIIPSADESGKVQDEFPASSRDQWLESLCPSWYPQYWDPFLLQGEDDSNLS